MLRIFTENPFSPIVFEIIQRKDNKGFRNGNFQAVFESFEIDQSRSSSRELSSAIGRMRDAATASPGA